MKAVVMNEYGGPEVLKFTDYRDPTPGPGEVLIRVAAASINPIDLLQRSGATKDFFPVELPGIIGRDVSGTVLELGAGVDKFSVGDKALALAFHTYAELCIVKANLLAKVPDDLDLVEAAALPLVTITGNQLISIASGIQSAQTVLVSGALGSVGRAAIYTAKEKGAESDRGSAEEPTGRGQRSECGPGGSVGRRRCVRCACTSRCRRQHRPWHNFRVAFG